MQSEVMEYFSSLDKFKSKKDGLIHTDSVKIELLSPRTIHKKVPLNTINGQPAYIKDSNSINSAVGIATSEMYRDIGFVTPNQYILTTAPSHRKLFSRAKAHDPRFSALSIITADISAIPNIESDLIDNIISERDKNSAPFRLGRYAWQFLYDPDVRAIMLEYMTPETFNEMIGDSLVAEVRTDIDRHFQNAFLYKRTGKKKYEGFIPIDLDNLELLKHIYGKQFTKDNFEEFLASTYESTAVTGKHCNRAYMYRIADLKEIIDDGVIPPASLAKLKSALEYDLPSTVDKHSRLREFSKQRKPVTTAYEMLWDYNRRELRESLGL